MKIRIEPDTDPMNPREAFDHLGRMCCFHKRYALGDKHELNRRNFNNWAGLRKHTSRRYSELWSCFPYTSTITRASR